MKQLILTNIKKGWAFFLEHKVFSPVICLGFEIWVTPGVKDWVALITFPELVLMVCTKFVGDWSGND